MLFLLLPGLHKIGRTARLESWSEYALWGGGGEKGGKCSAEWGTTHVCRQRSTPRACVRTVHVLSLISPLNCELASRQCRTIMIYDRVCNNSWYQCINQHSPFQAHRCTNSFMKIAHVDVKHILIFIVYYFADVCPFLIFNIETQAWGT